MQTYCRELVAALALEVGPTRLCARVQADAVSLLPAGVGADVRPVQAGVRRLLDGWRATAPAALVHGLDVDLPWRGDAPMVTTVHDLSVFDVPWAFSRYRSAGERLAVTVGLRRADVVIAVSQFTADAVAQRFNRPAVVTHLAPGPGFAPPSSARVEAVAASYRLPDRFVLHVGTIEPRKDVTGLAEACHDLGIPLVLAGAQTTALPNRDGLQWLGYVPAEDLAPLYAAADAVAYPSRYEGFGLPPIEAMACGAAVVATKVGALPELVGDTLDLVTVGDADGLRQALSAAVGDPAHQSQLRACGQKAVAALSWSDTARKTLDVYRSLGVSL